MKKLKLLPTILMLVLCVGVIAVGVFSITPTKNTISGTITISGSNPEFTIKVFKSEINSEGTMVGTESQVGNDYIVRSKVDLALGDLEFDVDEANTTDDVNDIKIRIEVTSSASDTLGMYFTTQEGAQAEASIADLPLGGGAVKCKFDGYTVLTEEGTASMCLTFSLESFVTGDDVEINLINTMFFNIANINESLIEITDANASTFGYTVIGNGLKSIDNQTYTSVGRPTKVKIAEGVETIADETFRNCSSITNIAFPNSLKEIGVAAFAGCTGLSSIPLNNGLTTIKNRAFANCTGLSEVTIPSSVTCLGTCFLYGDENWISDENFGSDIFLGCAVYTDEGYEKTWDDYGMDYVRGLTKITLQANTTLSKLEIPEAITLYDKGVYFFVFKTSVFIEDAYCASYVYFSTSIPTTTITEDLVFDHPVHDFTTE